MDLPSPIASAMRSAGRDVTGGVNAGTIHSHTEEEERVFATYINEALDGDEDCGHQLPIDLAHLDTLYTVIADGVLLCKLINAVVSDDKLRIDRRAINRKKKLHPIQKVENHNLAINSAINLGCRIVNIGATDLMEGRKHLVMGLLWQVIRFAVLDKISLQACPELYRLLQEGETIEDLNKLSHEELLLRWFNFHLAAAGSSRRVANFSTDVADSECYTLLLQQVSKNSPGPKCGPGPLSLPAGDMAQKTARAEAMLAEADKISCNSLITAHQVAAGNPRLNLAFTANIFNTMPGLEELQEEEVKEVEVQLHEVEPENEGDSREERAFRMWFNSLNIDREVTHLFEEVKDGMILLQAEDKISPGIVDWPKTYPRPKETVHALANCNFAVENSVKLGCQIVNIGGEDICEGNRKLILGLSWQLMKMNIFQILGEVKTKSGAKVDEDGLVAWANAKVAGQSVAPMTSFKDKHLGDSIFLLHMLDGVRADTVDWAEVAQPTEQGLDEDSKHANAGYLINLARKIGCQIFLTWEDVVEVQPKMITTLIAAALMVETAPTEEEKAKLRAEKESSAKALAAEEARQKVEAEARRHETEKQQREQKARESEAAIAAAATEKEKKDAERKAAKDKMIKKDGPVQRARKLPSGALDLSDPEVEEAWQQVSRDDNDTDWAVFKVGHDMKLKVVETGDDGLEGLVDELDESQVMFGFVQAVMPDGRPKFASIEFMGANAPNAIKSKAASFRRQLDDFFGSVHLKLTAREADELDVDELMEKLTKSGGASY